MIKIAAFIIPQKKTRFKILSYKKKVKKKFGTQPYLSHPPHCTLFTMNVSNQILKFKKNFKSINIKSNYKNTLLIKKTGIFANDPITSGKTIYFKITKTSFLQSLQLELLKSFIKFNNNKRKIKFKFSWMNKNNKKYGYPFVGKTWIPHFTVASLVNVNKDKKFIKNFLNKKIKSDELIKKIYIYKINKGKHIYLWSINIKLIK